MSKAEHSVPSVASIEDSILRTKVRHTHFDVDRKYLYVDDLICNKLIFI